MKMLYNPELQRRKGDFLWNDLTQKADEKLQIQHNNVMFLPFWFYTLQYIWWISNRTQYRLHQTDDRQSVVFRHKQADQCDP